jgi:integrase
VLTKEGAAFFAFVCKGRHESELMFTRANGEPWRRTNHGFYVREACERAGLKVHFHLLRHTWCSHAVMNGIPLVIVARNLGHVDTRMVERVYSHLAPSYVTDAIRQNGPRFVDQKIFEPQ